MLKECMVAVMSSKAGECATAHPTRQPVTDSSFEALPTVMVRSLIPGSSAIGMCRFAVFTAALMPLLSVFLPLVLAAVRLLSERVCGGEFNEGKMHDSYTSSLRHTTSCSTHRWATTSSSVGVDTRPVGLCGVLKMHSFVFSVQNA